MVRPHIGIILRLLFASKMRDPKFPSHSAKAFYGGPMFILSLEYNIHGKELDRLACAATQMLVAEERDAVAGACK